MPVLEASEKRSEDLAAMAKFRREWQAGQWKKAGLTELFEALKWFEPLVQQYQHHWNDDAPICEEIRLIINNLQDKLVRQAQMSDPIAYFRPSWTQAQKLNAWSPEFEDAAPEGYNTTLDVSAVRVGKTCADIIDMLLWLIPNDPEWLMFQPYTDFRGREVKIFRRPNHDYWDRTGKMAYDPSEPPKSQCENWHGCPDEMHWKEKLDREYRKWMPLRHVGKRGNDPLWNVSERWIETKWGSRINGKLYMSDMQAWSGKELFQITFDEGPPKDKLEEAKIRARYIRWSFTPREAANTGDRTRVAHEVYSGKLDLIPPIRVFQFGWDDVPEHIMTKKKKDIREAALKKGDAKSNRVTREGGFFFSSPVVFDKFDRQKHVLPVTGEVIRRAIQGKCTVQELQELPFLAKCRDANILRGVDEGTAHPSSCTWRAHLKTGESIIFREWCEEAHSITDRCKAIIEASGNELVSVKDVRIRADNADLIEAQMRYAGDLARDRQRERDTGAKLPRWREKFKGMRIRKTVADSKIFRRDPNYPLDDWTQNYSRAGLRMTRANNAPPAQRCDYVNGLFAPDYTRSHLIPAMDDPEKPHGFQVYVTKDCEQLIERLENYLHGQFSTGPRAGEFTGKPELRDDDLIDSTCYVLCERIRWQHPDSVTREGDR